ncbi:MAG TPA: hypothetical protein VGV64_02250 [Thermoplasmata archaeon]|nr:hypothetical protein [Thermoplasmata archaeon]
MVGGPTVPRGWLEETLLRSLPPTPQGNGRFRIVRFERARALVEVGHDAAADARKAWNATWRGPGGATIAISTRRTWGTLRKAKQWLAGAPDRPRPADRHRPRSGPDRTRRVPP